MRGARRSQTPSADGLGCLRLELNLEGMLVLMLRCWSRWSSVLLLSGGTTLSKVLALHWLLLLLVLLLLARM